MSHQVKWRHFPILGQPHKLVSMAVSDQQNILVLGKSGKTSQPGKTTGRTPSGRSGGETLGIPKFPYDHELESSHNSRPGPKPQVSHWNSQDVHQSLQEPPNHTWEADSEADRTTAVYNHHSFYALMT